MVRFRSPYDVSPFAYHLISEQSLSELDSAISQLKMKIARTDEEILKAVREQVSAGSKGKRDLEEAKKAISEVSTKNKLDPFELIMMIYNLVDLKCFDLGLG